MTPKVVHVSTVRGDDELGDGSQEFPVATLGRADEIASYGDVIAYDGGLGSMVPAQKKRVDIQYLLCWVVMFLIGAAFAWQLFG